MVNANIANFRLDASFTLGEVPDSVAQFAHEKIPIRFAWTAGATGTYSEPWGFRESEFVTGSDGWEKQYSAGTRWYEVSHPGFFADELHWLSGLTADAMKTVVSTSAGYVQQFAKSIQSVTGQALDAVRGFRSEVISQTDSALRWLHFDAHSPVLASVDVTIPADADFLSFAMSVQDPGNNDTLLVAIDSNVIGQVDLASQALSGGSRLDFWIKDYAGQTATLNFYMPSDKRSTAQFLISDIQFVTVNKPPVPDSVPDQSVEEGRQVSLTFTATDPDGDHVSYALDDTAPAGAAIDPITGVFTWTPTQAQAPGTYDVMLYATDDGPGNATSWQTVRINVMTPPVVSSEYPSETMIEASNAGSTFVVRVFFSEPMDMNVNPAVTFSTNVSSTLTPDAALDWWINSTTYRAGFHVTPNSSAYVPAVGINVTGGKDVAGNLQTPYQGANDFDIDTLTVPAHVVTAAASLSEVSQLNIGKPDLNAPVGQGFVVRVTYDTNMAYNLGYTPVVTIASSDVSPTLTYDAADSWWVNPTTYRAGFDVSASTENVQGFHIAVAGGHNLNPALQQYVQARYVSGEAFNINMTHALVPAYVGNAYPYLTLVSNRNVGSDTFGATVSFNRAMSMGANLAFSFSQGGSAVDVSNVLQLDSMNSYWVNSTDYKVQYSVLPGTSVNLANLGINVTGGMDPVGNPPVQYTGPTTGLGSFSIDTQCAPAPLAKVKSITTNLETVTAANTMANAGADSFVVWVQYDQPMANTASIPTLTFVPDPNWYPVASTLQLDLAQSWWTGPDTYRAKFTVQNYYTIVNPSVGIAVTGGKDACGNLQEPFSGAGTDYFEVNTAATSPLASVTGVVPSVATVTKANVGAPVAGQWTTGLVERIWFDQSMAGYSPVVTLTANDPTQQAALDATLSYDAAWSWWVSDTTFRAAFNVADSGVLGSAAGITIHVKWARSNTAPYYNEARYSGPANFNLDTLTPVSLDSLAASSSAASLTDAVLSSGALNLSIGGLDSSTNNQQSVINPIDKALALTGTWLDI